MRKFSLAFLTLFLALTFADAKPKTTDSPIYNGVTAQVDLPKSQHMRNTGGMGRRGPGTGSGLCVFTSIEMSGKKQNVNPLIGLQKYMTKQPGGGYPEKVVTVLKAYCKSINTPVPAYIQHTGGDMEFLDIAMKTGRLLAITYGGSDDFYSGYVAHMVNLCHLDPEYACIIDNNRPGKWVWMTRAELKARWTAGGNGGWAIILLDYPLPPVPNLVGGGELNPDVFLEQTAEVDTTTPASAFPITAILQPGHSWTVIDGKAFLYNGSQFVGAWMDDGWRPATGPKEYHHVASDDVPWTWNRAGEPKTGVDDTKIPKGRNYWLHKDGKDTRLSQHEAYQWTNGTGKDGEFLDDSGLWQLVLVGKPEDVKKRLSSDARLAKVLPKLKVIVLNPDEVVGRWYIDERLKNAKVRLQLPIKDGSTIKYEAEVVDWEALVAKLIDALDPQPKPVAPPITPVNPDGTPAPGPKQDTSATVLVGILVAVITWLVTHRKKEGKS